MRPWVIAMAAADVIGIGLLVAGMLTGAGWVTFTALGCIWVGAGIALAMLWRGKRQEWRR